MSVNRREFIRIGAIGAASISAASCWWSKESSGLLAIRIKGLCIVERAAKSVKVHLIDGNKVSMGVHEPVLSVSKSLVNPLKTAAPSTPDPSNSSRLLFDLTGKKLTLDAGDDSAPDLRFNDDPIDDAIPPDDSHWKSLKLSADLKTLCGATKITDLTKFYGELSLDHGTLQSAKADTVLGQATVWTFTRPTSGGDKQVAKQVLTNTLLCAVPTSGSLVTFTIGTQPLVLNLAGGGDVLLQNLPPVGTPGVCSGGNKVCVDHLEAFYDLVDAQFKPVAIGFPPAPPPTSSAEPNYCPPGSI
ncbi:MAG TPA: hypothetical protein VGJ29_07500 [Vicinamibacterales bacterium]